MNTEEIAYAFSSGKKVLGWILIILAVHSTAGFAMFVAEESMQTAMFGAFSYNSADDLVGLEWHYKNIMVPTQKSSKVIINVACIPGLLFCPAYRTYLDSNEGYVYSVERRLKLNGYLDD